MILTSNSRKIISTFNTIVVILLIFKYCNSVEINNLRLNKLRSHHPSELFINTQEVSQESLEVYESSNQYQEEENSYELSQTVNINHSNQIIKHQRTSSVHCPECKRDEAEQKLKAETLRNLRLERIKEKILHKLRLKEPPIAVGAKALPDPLIHAASHHQHKSTSSSRDITDDYYGKTEQIIVYAEEGGSNTNCLPRRSIPSACLKFKLPAEVIKEKVDFRVSTAELWVYKLTEDESVVRVFTIAEISTSDQYNGPKTTSLDPRHYVNSSTDGWESMNVSTTVGSWINKTLHFRMDREYPPLTLQIGCRNCTRLSPQGSMSMSPIDMIHSQYQPFLVINMAESLQKNRRRRNTNCQNGPSEECCRESFKVSFAQIGWNWIIEPKEFDAHYCKGTCTTMTRRHHHSSILQAHINRTGNTTSELQLLVPCCTPTKLEGITILYTLTNSTSVWKYLPNMVVESCGCA